MLKKVLDHGNPLLKRYNRFVDTWNQGSSSTHHNREIVDPVGRHNLMIELRNAGRDDLADQIQQRIERDEKEARNAEKWREQ